MNEYQIFLKKKPNINPLKTFHIKMKTKNMLIQISNSIKTVTPDVYDKTKPLASCGSKDIEGNGTKKKLNLVLELKMGMKKNEKE